MVNIQTTLAQEEDFFLNANENDYLPLFTFLSLLEVWVISFQISCARSEQEMAQKDSEAGSSGSPLLPEVFAKKFEEPKEAIYQPLIC